MQESALWCIYPLKLFLCVPAFSLKGAAIRRLPGDKLSLGVDKQLVRAKLFALFAGPGGLWFFQRLGKARALISCMIAITASLWVLLALPGPPKGNAAVVVSPHMPAASATVLDEITQIRPVLPALAAPAAIVPVKLKPLAPEITARQKHTWLALTVFQHGASTFDAWSTRYSINSGYGKELDPLMKPFAGSSAIYAVIQIAPAATDFLGRRLLHSRNPKLRRLWWLPQAAGTAAFTFSGVNNVRVANGR